MNLIVFRTRKEYCNKSYVKIVFRLTMFFAQLDCTDVVVRIAVEIIRV